MLLLTCLPSLGHASSLQDNVVSGEGLHSFPALPHVILVPHDVKLGGNHYSVFTMPLSNICARGNFLPHILPCLVAKVTIQQTHWCSLPLEGQSSWGVILPILQWGHSQVLYALSLPVEVCADALAFILTFSFFLSFFF